MSKMLHKTIFSLDFDPKHTKILISILRRTSIYELSRKSIPFCRLLETNGSWIKRLLNLGLNHLHDIEVVTLTIQKNYLHQRNFHFIRYRIFIEDQPFLSNNVWKIFFIFFWLFFSRHLNFKRVYLCHYNLTWKKGRIVKNWVHHYLTVSTTFQQSFKPGKQIINSYY